MNKKSSTVKLGSQCEMVGYLKSLGTECRFISMNTETEVKMRKTGNPFVGAVKRTKRNGLINVNFVKSVERKMAKAAGIKPSEVDYKAGETWYVHVMTAEGKPMPLCVDKKTETKHYLQYFPHRSFKTQYFHNGVEVSYSDLAPFITEKPVNPVKPLVITLAMKSIKNIKFRKITAVNETPEVKPLARLDRSPVTVNPLEAPEYPLDHPAMAQ